MALILPGNLASATAATGFDVDNSCRFNASDTSLTKSISSTNTSWTVSLWVKRAKLGATQYMISWGDSGVTNGIGFSSADKFQYFSEATSSTIATAAAYRDPSAWYHLVAKNSSGTITLYVNGVAITTTGGTSGSALSSSTFRIGGYQGGGLIFGGYMSEVCFIDSSALNPTSFGEFDSDSPTIWKPIDVSGLTFGTNGAYLDFEDSANLGNDANGGTDWTEANLDATDSATDVPTNNFCTWNPLENFYFDGVYSEGNTKVVTDGSKFSFNQASIGVSSGKWYWEVEPTAKGAGATDLLIGVTSTPSTNTGHTLGYYANDVGYRGSGNKKINNSDSSYGNTYDVNDIIGVALDLDNNKLYFSKAGTFQDSGDPTSGATGTGAISITDPASTTIGFYFPSISYVHDSATATFEANFGNPSVALDSGNADANGYGAFEYAPPSGYLALCTKNLGSDGG